VGPRNLLQGIDPRGQVEGIMKEEEMVESTRIRTTGTPKGILIIIGVTGRVIGAGHQGGTIGMVAMIEEIDIEGCMFDMSQGNK